MHIFRILLLALVLTSNVGAKSEDRVRSLDEILELSTPVKTYAEAYGSFIFSGQVEVTPREILEDESGQPTPPRVGTWNLRWDEKGNFHFTKTSLIRKASLDLIYLNHQFYLRKDHETVYRQVSPQAEFFSWINLPFQDVFSAWKKFGYGMHSDFKLQNAISCSEGETSKLCIDPVHHLPLQGQYVDSSNPKRSIQSFFSVQPSPPEAISIELPHSTEKP